MASQTGEHVHRTPSQCRREKEGRDADAALAQTVTSKMDKSKTDGGVSAADKSRMNAAGSRTEKSRMDAAISKSDKSRTGAVPSGLHKSGAADDDEAGVDAAVSSPKERVHRTPSECKRQKEAREQEGLDGTATMRGVATGKSTKRTEGSPSGGSAHRSIAGEEEDMSKRSVQTSKECHNKDSQAGDVTMAVFVPKKTTAIFQERMEQQFLRQNTCSSTHSPWLTLFSGPEF